MGIKLKNLDEYLFTAFAAGNASTGKKNQIVAPWAGRVVAVGMDVTTAGTTGSQIGDCNINGTSVFTTGANRPTIATGVTERDLVTEPDIDGTATFAEGDLIDLSIDQIHTTPAVDTCLYAVLRRHATQANQDFV